MYNLLLLDTQLNITILQSLFKVSIIWVIERYSGCWRSITDDYIASQRYSYNDVW